jgi:hypothetical protein
VSAYRTRRSRRGIALPAVLFLITLLTILGAAALTITGTERRVSGTTGIETQAYAIARTGLERFLLERESMGFTTDPPAPSESTRVMLTDGYADVVLTRVRADAGLSRPGIYVIRSRGVRTDRSAQRRPIAERTIAQFARWQQPGMQVLAAWTSMRGIYNAGPIGEINGVDACGAMTSVAGVAVPSVPGYVQAAGALIPSGTPNVLDLGDPLSTSNAITVDWGSVADGGVSGATVELPRDVWPSPSQWSDPSFWPIVFVRGNFALPSDGRGLLIVTGNLTMNGTRWWDGIVLVGGAVVANGSSTVNGATVTGLNIKFGGSAIPADSAHGSLTLRFHSCNIAKALAPFRGLSPYRNTTIDNWPTY